MHGRSLLNGALWGHGGNRGPLALKQKPDRGSHPGRAFDVRREERLNESPDLMFCTLWSGSIMSMAQVGQAQVPRLIVHRKGVQNFHTFTGSSPITRNHRA